MSTKPKGLSLLCLLVLVGCGASKFEGSPDAQVSADADEDAGEMDAQAVDDAAVGDASVDRDASSNAACTFNRDCPEGERCECEESTGCFCRLGPRGTGLSGVTPCQTGNDCETSLCVEGPGDVYYCSGECGGPEDCGPMLPICADIAFLGQVCIRQPPG